MTLLQIIDDKKQITGKKSIITACNVDYRLKRSGPYFLLDDKAPELLQYDYYLYIPNTFENATNFFLPFSKILEWI